MHLPETNVKGPPEKNTPVIEVTDAGDSAEYPEIETMTRKFQFVAVALAVLIVLGSQPLSARCVRMQQNDQETQHCAPDCPMMIHASGGVEQDQTVRKAPIPANCCNISTSRPEATVQLQVPASASVVSVSETVGMVDLEFGALADNSPICSFSLGRFSGQVLRI